MTNVRTLWMATAVNEPLPTRQVIRDVIVDRLSADDYNISSVGLYIIRVHPCNIQLKNRSVIEISNLPIFSIDFEDNCVVVRTIRATSVRVIARLEYADPLLMENLAEALQPLGICLVV